jgi:hypothetical protein
VVTLPDDPELTDAVLGDEIELLADIIDAASAADSVLTQDQIDSALGVPAGEEDLGGPHRER